MPLTAAEQIALVTGVPVADARAAYNGQIATSEGVRYSPEIERIARLPRREWTSNSVADAASVTELYRRPGGSMSLRPIQGAALRDLVEQGGALCPINVGGGKTLIAFLAPVLYRARRPLLIIPAHLIDKTNREFKILNLHWEGAPSYRIVSYQWLGRVGAAKFLETYQPDLIVADECYRLKNPSAAVTKRVKRYFAHYPAAYLGMSGTITKRSLKDYAHQVEWALKADRAPVPTTWDTIQEWSFALDEGKTETARLAPGALAAFVHPSHEAEYLEDPVRTVRRAFRQRLIDTPGIIATVGGKDAVEASLTIDHMEAVEDPSIDQAFDQLRQTWELPGGEIIADSIAFWRAARQLQCGFYYVWDPIAPEKWAEARRAWAKMCRTVLKENRRGLDSELAVTQAVDRDLYPEAKPFLEQWRAIRDTFKPNTVARWISDSVLRQCWQWAQDLKGGGIIWTEHTAFGETFSAGSGIPYYGRKGLDSQGRSIEDSPADKPLIASIAANGEGRNLQRFYRNLVVSSPPTGAIAEQKIGRTHRPGQEHDEVSVTYFIGCLEAAAGFHRSVSDARYIQDSTGQDQKLVYGDVLIPDLQSFVSRHGPRWNK